MNIEIVNQHLDAPASLAEAQRFLTFLDPEEPRRTFQTFDDNKDRAEWHKEKGVPNPRTAVLQGTVTQHFDHLVALNDAGAGIFVAVNATDLAGRKKANIVRVRAVFVDLDGAPLEPVLEAAIKPHLIIESSPGKYHAYWLIADCPLERFSKLQKALAAKFNGDPSVSDVSRVMRLPGFLHCKGEPFRTRIIDLPGAAR